MVNIDELTPGRKFPVWFGVQGPLVSNFPINTFANVTFGHAVENLLVGRKYSWLLQNYRYLFQVMCFVSDFWRVQYVHGINLGHNITCSRIFTEVGSTLLHRPCTYSIPRTNKKASKHAKVAGIWYHIIHMYLVTLKLHEEELEEQKNREWEGENGKERTKLFEVYTGLMNYLSWSAIIIFGALCYSWQHGLLDLIRSGLVCEGICLHPFAEIACYCHDTYYCGTSFEKTQWGEFQQYSHFLWDWNRVEFISLVC